MTTTTTTTPPRSTAPTPPQHAHRIFPPDNRCPACRTALTPRYGLCRHGLGMFDGCVDCGAVYGFIPDED